MAIKITPPLPQILLHGTRRLHSEVSSSNKDQKIQRTIQCSLAFCVLLILSYVAHHRGQKRGAQDLTARIPDGKYLTARTGLRKEEEDLKCEMKRFIMAPHIFAGEVLFAERYFQKKQKELEEKVEALDKEELEHLRQRARVLEGKLESRKASIETDRARESLREAVNAGILPDETHTETVDGPRSETIDIQSRDILLGTKEEGSLASLLRMSKLQRGESRSAHETANNIPISQGRTTGSQGREANEAPKTALHQDDSIPHTEPDTNITIPPETKTKTRPSRASNKFLESLAADNDEMKLEIGQIRRAKDALKIRERELEVQHRDRKKRVQELNAPKSGHIAPIASGMLLGSALAFGVTMMMSVFRS